MSLSPHRIAMLGTGFIADFYTSTLHNQRGIDRVQAVYSRSKERAEAFQSKWNVMHGSDNLEETVSRDDIVFLSSFFSFSCSKDFNDRINKFPKVFTYW